MLNVTLLIKYFERLCKFGEGSFERKLLITFLFLASFQDSQKAPMTA